MTVFCCMQASFPPEVRLLAHLAMPVTTVRAAQRQNAGLDFTAVPRRYPARPARRAPSAPATRKPISLFVLRGVINRCRVEPAVIHAPKAMLAPPRGWPYPMHVLTGRTNPTLVSRHACPALLVSIHPVNSLAPGGFVTKFRHVIFKLILVIDGWAISCEIALIWLSLDLSDDKSTLVQVMAWYCQATIHYLKQCWPRSLSSYGITSPQRAKSFVLEICENNF